MILFTSRGDLHGESIGEILSRVFGPEAVLIPGPEDLAAYVADSSRGYGLLADVYGSRPPEAVEDELRRR